MARPKRRYRLRNLDIDRVDLVDRGASAYVDENGNIIPLANIVIAKSDDNEGSNMNDANDNLHRLASIITKGMIEADVFVDDAEGEDFLDMLDEESLDELAELLDEVGHTVPLSKSAPQVAVTGAQRPPTPAERLGVDPYRPSTDAAIRKQNSPDTLKERIEAAVQNKAVQMQLRDIHRDLASIRADIWTSAPGSILFNATRYPEAGLPYNQLRKSADTPDAIADALDILQSWHA